VASDAVRLQAQRLFVVDGLNPSEIGRAVGVDRATVHRWRLAGNWDLARSEHCNKLQQAATEGATAGAREAARGAVLTAARRREILAICAESSEAKWSERIAAVRLDAELDPAANAPAGGGLADALRVARERAAGTGDVAG
jgi:hypothetical protein